MRISSPGNARGFHVLHMASHENDGVDRCPAGHEYHALRIGVAIQYSLLSGRSLDGGDFLRDLRLDAELLLALGIYV